MIILGLILLIIGWLVGMGLLTTIGGILILVGAILWILGATGRAVGGRKHFFDVRAPHQNAAASDRPWLPPHWRANIVRN